MFEGMLLRFVYMSDVEIRQYIASNRLKFINQMNSFGKDGNLEFKKLCKLYDNKLVSKTQLPKIGMGNWDVTSITPDLNQISSMYNVHFK